MRGADLAVGGHVPQPGRTVVARGGEGLAVGTERHRDRRRCRAGRRQGRADLLVGGHVPQPGRTVAPAVARILPSGLNATRGYARRWPDDVPAVAPICWAVATSHSRAVPSPLSGGEGLAVRAERHRRHAAVAGFGRAGLPRSG